jgi:hypothetical protein
MKYCLSLRRTKNGEQTHLSCVLRLELTAAAPSIELNDLDFDFDFTSGAL